MVYRRKKGARRPARTMRRKVRKGRARRRLTVRALNAFPTTMTTRHRYVETVLVPVGASSYLASSYAFRPNSMFDPNSTGTGHQPNNRDNMALVYEQYTVLSSKISVAFPPSSQSYLGVVRFDTQLGSTSSVEEILENPNLTQGNRILSDVGDKTKIARCSYNAKRQSCRGSNPLSDDNALTAVGSNPGYAHGFIINTMPVALANTVPAIPIRVQIDYICCWSSRVQQGLD